MAWPSRVAGRVGATVKGSSTTSPATCHPFNSECPTGNHVPEWREARHRPGVAELVRNGSDSQSGAAIWPDPLLTTCVAARGMTGWYNLAMTPR